MNIQQVAIDKIRPYENNPRNNDGAVEAVANSLREFGWQQPIVVDMDGVIIAGHTRYKAAKTLGMQEVPVVYANLPPEKVQAYRLADNKTGELAGWDFSKLQQELDELQTVEIDMEQFGFAESMSFIDEFANSQQEENGDKYELKNEYFGMTFVFNRAYEPQLNDYIKKFGKDEIVKMILQKAGCLDDE